MYIDCNYDLFWNFVSDKIEVEIWSPGKIKLNPGTVYEICFIKGYESWLQGEWYVNQGDIVTSDVFATLPLKKRKEREKGSHLNRAVVDSCWGF